MMDDDVRILVAARRTGQGMSGFPGQVPQTPGEAYAAQMRATAAWGDRIVGWKVGRINPPLDAAYGTDRFIGPVFADGVIYAVDGGTARFPVFPWGFGAFEAELVAVLAADAAPDRRDWDADSARTITSALHLGVEVAGSPIAGLPSLGPMGSIAAFGNNNGIILGPAIPSWREIDLDAIRCTVLIDGEVIASRTVSPSPAPLSGGPFAALAFALNTAAGLGQRLRIGDYILTGAITGVHPVQVGRRCTADFGSHGRIDCETVGQFRADRFVDLATPRK